MKKKSELHLNDTTKTTSAGIAFQKILEECTSGNYWLHITIWNAYKLVRWNMRII